MERIITISREFGSGGRELGRRLADKLSYAYYDREIIEEIAKRTSLSERYVQSIIDGHNSFSFPIHIGHSFYLPSSPLSEQATRIFEEQRTIVEELTRKAPCVIVGRCADYLLRETKPFSIFVYADIESKIIRCRKRAPVNEKLTDRELEKKIKRIDKKRAKYYEFYTGRSWGQKLNFDLCINTSRLDLDVLATALSRLF